MNATPLHRPVSVLVAALILSTLPTALALPSTGLVFEKSSDSKPAQEAVDIQMNLTGVATRTSGGPDPGFVAYINITGDGVRKTPNGNGVQIQGRDLFAEITIVRTSDNETVVQFTATVDFHAQQASSIAGGEEVGNFKFNLGLHGKRSENVLGSETGSRILAFNSNGDTNGPANDDGAHAVVGHGQTTLKDAGSQSATHYNIDLGGTASILTA